jgi:exopolysaccharide production protein ExoQ
MPRMFALFLGIGFVLFLFIIDRKKEQSGSFARWMIVAYLAMISSRAVSLWFNLGVPMQSPDDYLDGSPVDRNIYTAFLILGLLALFRRKVNWKAIWQNNGWIFLFFLFALISISWSDYPLVSFKRWVKNVGLVVMVLLLLTEDDPVQTLRWVFRKTAFLLLPLSVILIKYFPEFGRDYSMSGGQQLTGVTGNKNMLGAACFIYGVYFVWDLLAIRRGAVEAGRRTVLVDIGMLLLSAFLLNLANSVTPMVCLLVGSALLIFMEMPSVKRNISRFGVYIIVFLMLFGALDLVFGLRESIVSGLGRDMTFTGRVELWNQVLEMAENSALGSGYESFWLGDRAEKMWERYAWRPNQAHNGYLEIYLNLGVIGLMLLLVVMLTSYKNILLNLISEHAMGSLRMAFFLTVLLYNFSEGAFRLGQVWFIFFVSCLEIQAKTVKQPQTHMKQIRRVPARRLGAAHGRVSPVR